MSMHKQGHWSIILEYTRVLHKLGDCSIIYKSMSSTFLQWYAEYAQKVITALYAWVWTNKCIATIHMIMTSKVIATIYNSMHKLGHCNYIQQDAQTRSLQLYTTVCTNWALQLYTRIIACSTRSSQHYMQGMHELGHCSSIARICTN